MKQQSLKIQKDMIVGDVVALFPEASEILMSYGLHCVGCHANAFESIEQGLFGHGYDEQHLENLINELNEYYEESLMQEQAPKTLPPEADNMKIDVTAAALKKIKEIAEREEKKKIVIRVESKKFGPTIKYSMNFIEAGEIAPNEKIFKFQRGKISIVAAKNDYKKIDGINIDYIIQDDREGFKITNPHSAYTNP